MSSDGIHEERVTKTYEAPSGALVVVRNIPARVVRYADRADSVSYSFDVAERLDELINASLAGLAPSATKVLDFEECPEMPHADYELEFAGPEATFDDASLQVWRLVFDKAYTALKTAVRAAAFQSGKPATSAAIPRLAYIGPSSIVLGVRTSSQTYSQVLNADPDARERAMRLLVGTADWLQGDAGALPDDVASNAAVLDSLLRAVEELSPASDGVTSVRVRSRREAKPPVTLFRSTREAAKKRRLDLRGPSSGEERLIELYGTLAQIDVRGNVTLRDVRASDPWRKTTARCRYGSDLRAALLENFGKAVRVTVIQRRTGTQWSELLEVLDVIRETKDVI